MGTPKFVTSKRHPPYQSDSVSSYGAKQTNGLSAGGVQTAWRRFLSLAAIALRLAAIMIASAGIMAICLL